MVTKRARPAIPPIAGRRLTPDAANDVRRPHENSASADSVSGCPWRDAFGFESATARKAIEVADGRRELHDALMAVAGRSGKIDGRSLGSWLARHAADRVVGLSDDLVSQAVAMETCGQGQGFALWRLTLRE